MKNYNNWVMQDIKGQLTFEPFTYAYVNFTHFEGLVTFNM